MAQIIKIHDYISRYELDPYHYINQFVRLKKRALAFTIGSS